MESWPATYPLPMLRGGGRTQSFVIRTNMEGGFPRQRRQSTDTLEYLSVQWAFTDPAIFELFEAWWKNSIANGNDWFLMQLRKHDTLTTYQCRFAGQYSYQINDAQRVVGATLQVRANA